MLAEVDLIVYILRTLGGYINPVDTSAVRVKLAVKALGNIGRMLFVVVLRLLLMIVNYRHMFIISEEDGTSIYHFIYESWWFRGKM